MSSLDDSSFSIQKVRHISSPQMTRQIVQDTLALEVPLQISINNESYTITLRTPGADEELIYGLFFTEKICKLDHLEIKVHDFDENGHTTNINVTIPPKEILKDIHNLRSQISSTSCGFCGKKDLEDIQLAGSKVEDDFVFELGSIPQLISKLEASQKLFRMTGGTHGAALFSQSLEVLAHYEDVGRHNAVDKVIGKALMEDALKFAKILVVSGRVSYEIVAKAVRAQIPVIVAVSAPTSLAVDIARDFGVTLIGFCRQDHATVYSQFEKVISGGLHVRKS